MITFFAKCNFCFAHGFNFISPRVPVLKKIGKEVCLDHLKACQYENGLRIERCS